MKLTAWKKKENKDSKDFNGTLTRGSGNKWFAPGDSKNDIWLIESKQTNKKSYSLSTDQLKKIYDEALFSFRLPMMSIKIQNINVIVLFKDDFLNLIKKK